jgi:hypothetical protein
MKKINYQPVVFLSLLLTVSVALSSFSSTKNNFGGEGFEVYLNDKLVLQQYGKEMDIVKNLQLDQSASNGQLPYVIIIAGNQVKAALLLLKTNKMLF